MRAATVQTSLRIRAVSPEPPLLAHTSRESKGTFRQKTRSLAPLNGWACAVKICHDGMLEDTNSLDGAHISDPHMCPFYPRMFINPASCMSAIYKMDNENFDDVKEERGIPWPITYQQMSLKNRMLTTVTNLKRKWTVLHISFVQLCCSNFSCQDLNRVLAIDLLLLL